MRIMIADDNRDNLNILSRILAMEGHSINTAENGLVLLKKIAVENYDIILLDIEMPVMDGLTAIAKMRNSPEFKRTIPVIAMTAHRPRNSEYTQAGFTDVITKPVDFKLLSEMILRYCGTSGK